MPRVRTFVVEFARAKRRSANLTSEVDENRVTLMDDPRLSNYFASTGASGKNRYGSSLKTARGISWEPSMVDGRGRRSEVRVRRAIVRNSQGEAETRALSIFLFFPGARFAWRRRRTRRASIHEIFLSLSVLVTNRARGGAPSGRYETKLWCHASRPLPPSLDRGRCRRRD